MKISILLLVSLAALAYAGSVANRTEEEHGVQKRDFWGWGLGWPFFGLPFWGKRDLNTTVAVQKRDWFGLGFGFPFFGFPFFKRDGNTTAAVQKRDWFGLGFGYPFFGFPFFKRDGNTTAAIQKRDWFGFGWGYPFWGLGLWGKRSADGFDRNSVNCRFCAKESILMCSGPSFVIECPAMMNISGFDNSTVFGMSRVAGMNYSSIAPEMIRYTINPRMGPNWLEGSVMVGDRRMNMEMSMSSPLGIRIMHPACLADMSRLFCSVDAQLIAPINGDSKNTRTMFGQIIKL